MDKHSGVSVKEMATEWFVRLRDEPVSDADKAAFETWKRVNPAHVEAYNEMVRLWTGFDQVNRPSNVAPGKKFESACSARRHTLRRMAMVASVVIVAGVSAYILSLPWILADHRTHAGQQRTIVLEDGSTLHLNTATAISMDFTQTHRRILLHAGEAYFEVAKDVTRPFIVDAQVGQIEALGTTFSAKRADDRLDVIVTESRVRISGSNRQSAIVAAGQSIQVTEAGLGTVATTDTTTTLAWRRGLLVFENRPLSDVLTELARYRQGHIVIMDESLKTLPVTGSFSIEKTNGTLEMIEQTLPVRLYELSDLLILVFHDSSR